MNFKSLYTGSFLGFLFVGKMKYEFESKVLQYFANLFALFFKLQQNQPSIQSRGYHAAPFEATPKLDPMLIPVLILQSKGHFL